MWKMKDTEKQENRLSKVFKGRRSPGSGSKWYCKGDSKSANFLIEAKGTEKGYVKFSVAVWNKVRREALGYGKIPLICVEMKGKGVGHHHNYVIFDVANFDDFYALDSISNSISVDKSVTLDKDFIILNTPFILRSKEFTFVMMREREFLESVVELI